jgi:heat shock protein HtpX
MTNYSQYSAQAADWRAQLRRNGARTRLVIVLFILLYTGVGLLLDLFFHHMGYSQIITGNVSAPVGQVPLGRLFIDLVTFKIVPYATLIMLGVAVVSLWITYALYDRVMLLGTTYRQVTDQSTGLEEKQLYNVVEEMKVAAGLRYMPKIFIIDADYMNAFASGYSEKSAMIAITRGLMQKLDRSELQAVMAHELSHIRHGDIKLTLTASVLSNLMLMAIDVLFYGVIFGGSSDNRRGGGGNALVIIIMIVRILLPIVTVFLMLYLSRTREYMADAGSVELMRDNDPLKRALIKIHDDHIDNADQVQAQYAKTPHEGVRRESYIYDPTRAGFKRTGGPSEWFSTHPSIEHRLEALGFKTMKRKVSK